MITYDDLIEQDDQAILMTLRDSLTDAQFRVGDMCLKYLSRKNLLGVSKAFIYSAIGNFYGKKSRTVREYAMVCDFFPPEERADYPLLAFDHFRMAMKVPNWKEVLEYAMTSQVSGRPATVDDCISKFGIKAENEESFEVVMSPIRKWASRLPSFVRDRVEKLLDELEEIIKSSQ